MDERMMERSEGAEIDFQRLFNAIWSKKWLIAITAVTLAVVTFLFTLFFITPQYESSAMFYVNNSASIGGVSISLSDLSAAKDLVDSYIVILQTKESLDAVIDYSGVNIEYEDLLKIMDAGAVNATQIFKVTVTHPDPATAEALADAIAYVLPKRISTIIEGTSAKIVDSAILPSEPASPSYTINTVLGFVIGLVLMASIVALREVFDVTVRTEDDVMLVSKLPVLASVPDMTAPSKGGYYYYYGSKGQSKKTTTQTKEPEVIGPNISFAAAEAYKLLRTKLQFSFTDDSDCRVIGVSSAMSGEGKSLSMVNLAYTLSQLDKKVLLIDCDMRRPSIATKLPVSKAPGLSDYLSGQITMDMLFQPCGMKGEENAFTVVAAGRNPPNPVELLSSARMTKMVETLRKSYDYILLDLPPVGEVSDALAVAKITDGILLVVREDYCNRVAYAATVRQFEFVDAKVLGVIYNCSYGQTAGYGNKYGRYGKYGKYGKYGRRYYRYSSYQKAAEESQQPAENTEA